MLLVGFGRDDFDVAPFPVVALLVAAPFLTILAQLYLKLMLPQNFKNSKLFSPPQVCDPNQK